MEPTQPPPATAPEFKTTSKDTKSSPLEEKSTDLEPPASAPLPGRRKVKRKVTKKIRTKDEDGYLITREVTEWEEVSEDDIPIPVKPAPKPNAFAAMKQAPSSQKGKKDGVGKKMDITSFFGRK